MGREEIIEMILEEVSTEFGTERIKGFKYFGPYEGEDLVGIVYLTFRRSPSIFHNFY